MYNQKKSPEAFVKSYFEEGAFGVTAIGTLSLKTASKAVIERARAIEKRRKQRAINREGRR